MKAHRTSCFIGTPKAAVIIALAALLMMSCAPGPQSRAPGGASTDDRPTTPRTLRMGMLNEPTGGIVDFGSSSTNAGTPSYVFHAGLTRHDAQGVLQPHLAQKVPSLEDRDWVVFPDGQMEVTWKLRPDARWHDGIPLSAEDFVLGTRMVLDSELSIGRPRGSSFIADARASDPQTLVVHWKQPYNLANVSSPTDRVAIPNHLVGELYQEGDKQVFINSRYWTEGFVGLGPYRLAGWVRGSHIEALAFDQYTLGRPKIDSLVIRYFTDTNAMIANLLFGEVDLIPDGSLRPESVMAIRQQWDPTGAGDVITSPNTLIGLYLQFRDPDVPWVADVRVRQALSHLIDRQAIVDTLTYGLTTPAYAYVAADDPVFQLAEQQGLQKFSYNPTQAERVLAEAGWARGPGGLLRNRDGGTLDLEVRNVDKFPDLLREGLAYADAWKAGGVNTSNHVIPDLASDKNEQKNLFPGAYLRNDKLTPTLLEVFTSASIATPQNRWTGNNAGAYRNPTVEELYRQSATTIDLPRRQSLQADLVRLVASEVITIPIYYGVESTVLRKGIRGLTRAASVQPFTPWNIHAWEMG